MKVVDKASFRLATPDDAHLEAYDNTKLVAMNTCPTWGVLRYQMHKVFPGGGRAMALEAGTTMHEMFAWVRLCTLFKQLTDVKLRADMFNYHGKRLFGQERFDAITASTGTWPHVDMEQYAKEGAITVIETSGFFDDPSDKRRTITNMEECALGYIDRWRWQPVWIREPDNPTSDVGIEIPFDVVVDLKLRDEDENGYLTEKGYSYKTFRLTGKIDGLHVNSRGEILLDDNKTASRLNDAWTMSFALSSQFTGYMVAASVFTEGQIRNGTAHGITIPLPKNYDFGGIVREDVRRDDKDFKRWINWLLHTIELFDKYQNNPYDTPRYTHSCGRYFRPCSFIPFCAADDDEQRNMVENEMVTEEWSPLHEKTED